MGRRSYEEIGKPLPGRHIIVVSKTKCFHEPGVETASSLEEALKMAKGQDVYISGGAGLYEQVLPFADKMYITIIEKKVEGDTYFPVFQEEEWECEVNQRFAGEVPYTYMTYIRKNERHV